MNNIDICNAENKFGEEGEKHAAVSINHNKPIILSAGGTGGHLFPAKALSAELIERGYQVHIITDKRALKIVHNFDGAKIYVVHSATFKSKSIRDLIKAIYHLIYGSYQSYRIFRKVKPVIVGGFGGYPTLPPMFVASSFIGKIFGIKTFIHEQNAVMGRANKFLAKRVNVIAGGFLAKEGRYKKNIAVTGNPVRKDIIEAASFLYKPPSVRGKFNLLVFGGSQGASFFSSVIPEAIALLEPSYRKRLYVVQQSRGDLIELKDKYRKLGVDANIAPFFYDLSKLMYSSHFIISRSGASTISELSVIGRPALLVPYPHAIDNDQQKNAARLEKSGGVYVYDQHDLDAQKISVILKDIMDNPKQLETMAKSVKRMGEPKATINLAQLVEGLICKRKYNEDTN